MPHLRLEYSKNIKEQINPKELFSACHRILVHTIHADLFACQSRALPCDLFYVGDGSIQDAFVYLEIIVLEGRSPSLLQEMQEQIQKVLEGYFSHSLQELNLQIAMQIIELSRSHYFKITSKKPRTT